MGMKISISSFVGGPHPESAVKRLVKAGFQYAELGAVHSSLLMERTPDEWKKFREFSENAGLKFRQGHLRHPFFITEEDEEKRRAHVELHRNYCRMYHALGIEAAVIHAGGYEELLHGKDLTKVRALKVKSLKELLSDLPEGMTLCLENLPYETFDDLYADLEAMDFPENLGICLDTGHLHFSPKPDYVDFIRRAGKHLKALHIHDNPGPMVPENVLFHPGWHGSDKHMFPSIFRGGIKWHDVFNTLREINYDHLWNLEVFSDLYPHALHQQYRDMILKQDLERAKMLFAYDPDAPDPDDPVNDYSALEKVTSEAVSAEVEKYAVKITTPDFTLTVDPVHGGRISNWEAFGSPVIHAASTYGWGCVSCWQPVPSAFVLSRTMMIESLKAVPGGVELTMSRVLNEENDSPAFSGAAVRIVDTVTAESFTRKVTVSNTTQQEITPFAFRFLNLQDMLKKNESSTVQMDDGAAFERCGKAFTFRLGEKDNVIEAPMASFRIIGSRGGKLYLDLPGTAKKLELSFKGEKPANIFFWDVPESSVTCEAIFRTRGIAPGESCEFEQTVTFTDR